MLLLLLYFYAVQLIVITPDKDVTNEASVVNEMFANGLQRLHLRKPSYSTADYRKYINGIDIQYHTHIVLTGSFELLDEFALGGVHLNTAARNDKFVRQVVSVLPTSKISTSFHSWQDIKEGEFPYGYVFISPVFDSISKKGYYAEIDLGGAGKIKGEFSEKNKHCPAIIGLGGVGVRQIEVLHQNNFDGVAVLGAVWLSADPVGVVKKMVEITSRY